ncbi:MAG: hypothetical protein LBL49_06125 [Clostridiales Family XIII bacterium]|jgi:hypothetical protein|nr:hypothetical protein [Clostridiales Family XIII bacterium]
MEKALAKTETQIEALLHVDKERYRFVDDGSAPEDLKAEFFGMDAFYFKGAQYHFIENYKELMPGDSQ